jgi:O-acetyl-ADP-ribose deacetylase (regulator of RNase III)
MERRPTAFVASSTEHLDIAQMVQENLEQEVQVTVWSQDVVGPSSFVLDDLVRQLDDFDFGIFVFAPDDKALIRGTSQATVRDNVLFEMGLFVGRLGKDRTFVLSPSHASDMRTASDLLGLTTVQYDSSRDDQNLSAALGPASSKIARVIKAKGIRPERLQREESARQRAEAARARIAELTPSEQIIVDEQIGASSFVVINDDICHAASDVIVSSDDNHFTSRGGVSKAILKMLGPGVRQQLDYYEGKGFRQGHLVITTGGHWNRRAVIHAAVIDLDENRYPTEESIRSVTRRILNCAVALGARTIALPVLGGGYATRHLSSSGAATAISAEIIRFLQQQNGEMGDLRRVALYIFDRADADGLAELLETLCDREADPANRGFVTRSNATSES